MKIRIDEIKSWYVFGIEPQEETPETPYEGLHLSIGCQALHTITIHTCIGYVRRVTHDEIADRIG